MGKSIKESEWWNESIELVSGCTPISESCKHCWSAANTNRFRGKLGLTDGCHFNGKVIFNEKYLPRLSKGSGKRIVIWNDLFHEDVLFGNITDVWRMIYNNPHNIFMLLTKRINRVLEYMNSWIDIKENNYEFKDARGPDEVRREHKSGRSKLFAEMIETWGEIPDGLAYPPFDWAEGMLYWPNIFHNLHIGVTVENQVRADERIPTLLQIPAAVRFVSCTLMGPIDFENIDTKNTWPFKSETSKLNAMIGGTYSRRKNDYFDNKSRFMDTSTPSLSWILIECERINGKPGRGCEDEALWWSWAEDIVGQCKEAEVPVFVKQICKDGRVITDIAKFPKMLQIREYPK